MVKSNQKQPPKQPQQAAPNLPTLALDEIQSVMPHYVQASMKVFDDENEKATILISTITALSALLPNVHGIYDRRRVRANIYTMTIADAASGKGAMRYAEKLVLPIDKHLYESTPPPAEGKPREEKLLVIPANTSKAKLLQHIAANYQSALMLETEADTLKTALKSDHGGFTDIFRQLSHHETIRKSTVKDGQLTRIENGALSVCLTGTPDQMSFIDTVQNGLFSRFLFYNLPDVYEWRDVSPQGRAWNYDDHFNALGGQLLYDWQYLQNVASFEQPLHFELTTAQWADLNATGRQLTKQVKELGVEGKELRATVRRLMLIAYRTAMTLTATNAMHRRQAGGSLICTDDYFEAAMSIADVCFDHASFIANQMLKREHKARKQPETVAKMITAIEQAASPRFTKQQLLGMAQAHGISEGNFNNRVLPKLPLAKKGHGLYERTF